MNSADIIIIGAGAAGLMAAYQLSKAGKKVILLEARDRPGGRIHTITDTSLNHLADAGAEFIHGRLPVTFELLKEAGIGATRTDGKNWVFKENQLRQAEDMIENWDLLIQRMKKVTVDLPLADFLNTYLPEPEWESLREAVKSFAEGYDTADTTKASTLALRDEWSKEEQWEQYRPHGGYISLVNHLAATSLQLGAAIHLSSIVKELQWRNGEVEALTEAGGLYSAQKAIITVPLGILQAPADAKAAIRFTPEIPDKIDAAHQMGFGAVIKMLLEFDHAFWNERRDGKGNNMKEMSYLFTDGFVPTWWTQFPDHSPMLTAWLGGPRAAALKDAAAETVLQVALETLADVFDVEKTVLRKMITSYKINNWTMDPFTLGAYAYNTLRSAEAKKQLLEPVSNTLYFAGEALGKGYDCATVEVALTSGKEVATSILTDENIKTAG